MEDHHRVSTTIADGDLNTPASTQAHITRPQAAGPATVADQYDRGTQIARFNSALAVAITKGVGSMWCAYALLTFFGLPSAIHDGLASTVQ